MNQTNDATITQDEIKLAAAVLAKFEPGYLPFEIFRETSRLTVAPVIEMVPLRMQGDKVEVLLTRREADDPFWPNMLHTTGTVILASDQEYSYVDAFRRILVDELQDVEIAGEPQHVTTFLHKNNRGMVIAQVYYAEVMGKPKTGEFYDAESLPADIVDSQTGFIQQAVDAFRKQKWKRLQENQSTSD